jgi:outer membrane protein assembly factor BamB
VGVPAEEVSVALIELDLDAPPPATAGRPPIRYYRYAGLLLTAILTLVLGAATTASAVVWRSDGSFPLPRSDTSVQLLGDRLYTMDTSGEQRVVTAWSMTPLRRLWSTGVPLGRDPESGVVVRDGNAYLTGAGRNMLLQTSFGSTVLDTATGAIRWATGTPVEAVSDGVGIVPETRFRPGTVYDESSGNPGLLYWSSAGRPHTEPPERTTLRALDLATGRRLWSADERGSVYVVPAVAAATGFVVIAANGLTARAAATGRVLRQHALAAGDVSYPDMDGEVLLLRHDRPDGSAAATAYALDTLEPLWRLAEPADTGSGSYCTDLPCRADATGLTVLDPRRGTPLWHAGTYIDLIRRGAGTLQIQAASSHPLKLRDPRTGAALAQLSGWDSVADSDPDDPIVLFRAEPPDGHVQFAVVPPAGHGVLPLGRADARVRGCWSDARHIACRAGDGVQVWSYRT